MVGRNRFISEFTKASKELRTGKKTSHQRKVSKKAQQNKAYETGFLIGALKSLFNKK